MSQALAVASRRRWAWKGTPGPAIGAVLMGFLLLCAIAPGAIAPYSPLAFDYHALLQPPSAAHWFGTDNFGRDIFSRVIYASRVDMQIAVFSTSFPFLFGTALGCLLGYFGGIGDAIFLRLVDMIVTMPFLVLVIAIVAVLGPGLPNMYIAISVVDWIFYARIVRSEVLVQKRRDYIAAAEVMGYGPTRIIFRHLLPNVVTPAIIYWMTDAALAVLLGSSLGYLGLGAQPPTSEWGVLIADGKNFMTTAWWMSIFPGFAIVAAGAGFSLVGDGVAAALRRRG